MSEGRRGVRVTSLGFLFVLVGIVVAAWVSNALFLRGMEERGTFGDMFGVANALFSGLAFAGVLFAIFLQREDLETQKKQLELNRKELEAQGRRLDEQYNTLRRQAFEGAFFQLVRLHAEMVTSMAIMSDGNVIRGRECFQILRISLGVCYRDATFCGRGCAGICGLA